MGTTWIKRRCMRCGDFERISASRATWREITLLTCFVALAGCGRQFVPVEGTVTLDGKPLAGATVAFVPEGPGQPASGFTDNEGVFRAGTLAKADGAAPGK